MEKAIAIEQLGGSIAAAAEAIGVSYQAVNQWPDTLPPRISDRVQAALWRMHSAAGAADTPKTAQEATHG